MNLSDYLSKEGIAINDSTIEDLNRFADILVQWNKIHNLTGSDSYESIYMNIVDSLFVKNLVDPPNSLLDVGTGAGFPGIVLAMLWRSCRVVLCEPRVKRASFLRHAVTELGLGNVTVARKRVEELTDTTFEMISSRAVTDVGLIFDMSKHLIEKNSKYILYKGENVHKELSNIHSWKFSFDTTKRGKRIYLVIRDIVL